VGGRCVCVRMWLAFLLVVSCEGDAISSFGFPKEKGRGGLGGGGGGFGGCKRMEHQKGSLPCQSSHIMRQYFIYPLHSVIDPQEDLSLQQKQM
jgi:hypothetical protein